MAAETKPTAASQEIESGGESLEYVTSSVPDSKRKSLVSLTFVLAGYPIALSNFVIGGKVGVGLTFSEAISALLAGNAFLILIVILTGLLAFRTGLSTSFLSRRVFGIAGSSIFSVLLALSAVTWVSANGDIFARMILATFSWWPLTVPITAVVVILLWMQSAIRGYKGLQFVSYLGVPAAIIMAAWGVGAMLNVYSYSDLVKYVPETPITFASATSQIVGGWIFGAVITPDVCRYAKSRAHVVFAGFVAFIIGCFGLQFAGALVAIATGTGDFIVAMAGLGLIGVAFVCAIFCLWTTQDNNIYGASLAMQNVITNTKYSGKIKHWHIAMIISLCAAVLAALGIYTYLSPAISALSVLFPALPGLLLAEIFIVRNPQHHTNVNPRAIIAWVCGGVVGYLALRYNWFVPPVLNMIASGVVYAILMMGAPKKAGEEEITM